MQQGSPFNLKEWSVKAGPTKIGFFTLKWEVELHHFIGEKHAAARRLEPFGDVEEGLSAYFFLTEHVY